MPRQRDEAKEFMLLAHNADRIASFALRQAELVRLQRAEKRVLKVAKNMREAHRALTRDDVKYQTMDRLVKEVDQLQGSITARIGQLKTELELT